MTRGRKRFVPSPGSTGSPLDPQTSRPKPNRLSRSFRQTQTSAELGSPKSQPSDFKTPTRTSRSRASGAFSAESPHNDSDFQQDIIWDAGSPSPGRLGRRGPTRRAGLVDISEIVSRIAPEHGRPRVAEPTLQRWIGDSAAIPCTPDAQVPKPKRKSPRPTAVDDLLKLAKQFDFNMFHRDEEKAEDRPGPELQSEDPLPGPCGAGVRVNLDPCMEDDLDFLFDGPTQHVSGTISQNSAAEPPGKHCPEPKKASASDFDDWDDDDLLNDSLVIGTTQNPQNFIALNLCSTQKPASGGTPAHAGVSRRIPRSNRTTGQRTSFNLSDPNFSVRTSPEDASPDARRCRTSSASGFSVEAGSHQTRPLKSEPPSCRVTGTASHTKPAPGFSTTHNAAPAGPDVPDEDLDSFFSTDLVWDDPADDNLLCEMCEDLENQLQNTESAFLKVTSPGLVSKHRAALQPSNRTWDNWTQPPAPGGVFLPKQPRPGASGGLAGGSASLRADLLVKDSFRNSQTQTAPGSSTSRVQSAAAAAKDQFTFKKPNGPVPTVSNKVLGKCSAAEIELKKQQAMERRRRRLNAAQNLRAPP